MNVREQLIAVTAELIRKQGVSATGLAEILNNANQPKGSLYHYFPNGKEELVIAAIDYYKEMLSYALKKEMKGKGNVIQSLNAVIDFFIKSLEKTKFKMGCPLATVALEASGNNKVILEACKNVMEYWTENLTHFFEYKNCHSGKEESYIFMTRLEGAILMSQLYNDTKFLHNLKNELKNLIYE